MTISLNTINPPSSLIDPAKINKFIQDGGLDISAKKHLTLKDFIVSELVDLINAQNVDNKILVEALKIVTVITNPETTDFKPFLPQLLQAFSAIKENLGTKSAKDKSLALSQICLIYNKQFHLKLAECLGEKAPEPQGSMLQSEIKSFAFFKEIFRRIKKLNNDLALKNDDSYVLLAGTVYGNFKQPDEEHIVLDVTQHEEEFIIELLKFEKAFDLYSDAFWNLAVSISEQFALVASAASSSQAKSRLQKLSGEISHAKLYYQLLQQMVNQKIKFFTENQALNVKKIDEQNNIILTEFRENKVEKIKSVLAQYPKEHHKDIVVMLNHVFKVGEEIISKSLPANDGALSVKQIYQKVINIFFGVIDRAIESADGKFERLEWLLVQAYVETKALERSPIIRMYERGSAQPLPHREQNPEKNKLESDFFAAGNSFLATISENLRLLMDQHSSASQTDADFYGSLEEWDNLETEEKTSAPKPAKTKQTHPPKIKPQPKAAAKTETEVEKKKADIKSDTAAFLENVGNLAAQDSVHQSMAILAQKVQLSDTSAVAKEVQSHFFMAGASLELMASLLAEKDISSLGTLAPMHLMDCHILIEQMVTLDLMQKGQEGVHSHSLVKLLKEADLWDQLDIPAAVFMRNIDQGLIWTRYLGSSIKKTRGELPQGLAQLSACFDLLHSKQISKAKLQNLLRFVVHAHYRSLKFVADRLGWDEETKKIIELYSEKGLIEQQLLGIINEFKETDLTQPAAKPSAEQEQILSIHEKICRITNKMTSGTSEENHLKDILKDIQFHLLRMAQSTELSKKGQKPYFSSLFARNLMNMQWVFEQLYGARFLLKNHFATNIHEFKTFQLLLGDNYQQKHSRRLSNPETISKFNFGLSGHYPHKKADGQGFDLAAAIEADRAQYLVPENFKPIGKKSKPSGNATVSKTLLSMLAQNFPGGLTQASNLLQDLIREGALDIATKDMIRV